jgi:Xaa-Pro dipeptidase
MLTKTGCTQRLERLKGRLDAPWDALVIHRPEHLLYFANFYPDPSTINLHSTSFLVAERDGPTRLFTDNWLAPAAEVAADSVHVTTWYDMLSPAARRATAVQNDLCDHLLALGVGQLAAELSFLPTHVAGVADAVFDIESTILAQREIKDADELDAIRRGIRTAEAAHAASRDALAPGRTELEVYSDLLSQALLAAEAPFVMMCDLVSGPRASVGTGPPTSRIVEEGDLVIFDLFPYVSGYRGDITNTLVAGADPTQEQNDDFHATLEALGAGEEALRPGAPVREVFAVMDTKLREAKQPLRHHGGHAIGLGHPEAPEIVPESERMLEEGMVVTLEPGLYDLPTGGIRLEHNFLITGDGFERLSNHRLGLA